MHDVNRVFLPANDPLHVHQTTHVGRRDHLAICLEVIGNPVTPHRSRHICFIDRKRTAEATAFVRSNWLTPVDISNQIHDGSYLVDSWDHRFTRRSQSQFPEPVTALMQ